MKCVLLFLLGALLAGCSGEQAQSGENAVKLYYVANTETKVVMQEYDMQATDTEAQLAEMAEVLAVIPEKLEYKPPLSMGFSLLGYELMGNMLILDVDSEYQRMKPTTEVLVRAALVRSFSQIEGVSYVSITVEGESLHDNLGNVVGPMRAAQFIDNAGSEINTTEEIRLKLYFANETGDALVVLNRTLAYNTNISVEKLVVEQILAGTGPTETGCFPTIGADVELISVTTKDGVCYVNLSEEFLTPGLAVSPEVTIYSVVNSLTELVNINKVQILINGEDNVTYREKYNFTTLFERNLDL